MRQSATHPLRRARIACGVLCTTVLLCGILAPENHPRDAVQWMTLSVVGIYPPHQQEREER